MRRARSSFGFLRGQQTKTPPGPAGTPLFNESEPLSRVNIKSGLKRLTNRDAVGAPLAQLTKAVQAPLLLSSGAIPLTD